MATNLLYILTVSLLQFLVRAIVLYFRPEILACTFLSLISGNFVLNISAIWPLLTAHFWSKSPFYFAWIGVNCLCASNLVFDTIVRMMSLLGALLKILWKSYLRKHCHLLERKHVTVSRMRMYKEGKSPRLLPQNSFSLFSRSPLSLALWLPVTLISFLFLEEPKRLFAVAVVQNAFLPVICVIYFLLQASEMPSSFTLYKIATPWFLLQCASDLYIVCVTPLLLGFLFIPSWMPISS